MGELVVHDRRVVGVIGVRTLPEDHRVEIRREEGIFERLVRIERIDERRKAAPQGFARAAGIARSGGNRRIELLEEADVLVEMVIRHRRGEIVARRGVRGVDRKGEAAVQGGNRRARSGNARRRRGIVRRVAVVDGRLRSVEIRSRRQVRERDADRRRAERPRSPARYGAQVCGRLDGRDLEGASRRAGVGAQIEPEERRSALAIDHHAPVAGRLACHEIHPVDCARHRSQRMPAGLDASGSDSPEAAGEDGAGRA